MRGRTAFLDPQVAALAKRIERGRMDVLRPFVCGPRGLLNRVCRLDEGAADLA